MSLIKVTIDLQDAPEQIEEQIEQSEEAKQTLLEKVDEKYPETEDSPGGFIAAPESYEDKFYELQNQKDELASQKARFEKFLEDSDGAGGWESTEFVFQEPSLTDGLYIEGRSSAMADKAKERGEEVDGRLFGVEQSLERCLVEAPDSAPKNLSNNIPRQVGQWLLDRVSDETTVGVDADLGNSSPQEALESYRSSQQS